MSEQPRDAMEAVRAGMGKVHVPNQPTFPPGWGLVDGKPFGHDPKDDAIARLTATLAARDAEIEWLKMVWTADTDRIAKACDTILGLQSELAAVTTERDAMRDFLDWLSGKKQPTPAPDVRAEAEMEMWKRCREAVRGVSGLDTDGYNRSGSRVWEDCLAAIDKCKPTAPAGTGGEGGHNG